MIHCLVSAGPARTVVSNKMNINNGNDCLDGVLQGGVLHIAYMLLYALHIPENRH